MLIAALTLIAVLSAPSPEPAPAEAASLPPMPKAVSSFGAVTFDAYIYIYGGHNGKTHKYSTDTVVTSLHRLRLPDGKAWEPVVEGPGLQGLALVAHGRHLYRLGGMQPRNPPGEPADLHSVAECARLDPAVGQWEPLPPLPAPRSSHDAVVLGDRIIVVGGWSMNGKDRESEWCDTTLVLDLSRQPMAWQSVAQPFRRRALQAAVYDGKVYVIGGLNEDGNISRAVAIFDPDTGKWITGPELPKPSKNGFSPAAVAAAGRLYVSPADGKVYRLSTDGKTWDPVGKLQHARIVHRMVADAGQLIVLGGAGSAGNVAVVERVVPSPH